MPRDPGMSSGFETVPASGTTSFEVLIVDAPISRQTRLCVSSRPIGHPFFHGNPFVHMSQLDQRYRLLTQIDRGIFPGEGRSRARRFVQDRDRNLFSLAQIVVLGPFSRRPLTSSRLTF